MREKASLFDSPVVFRLSCDGALSEGLLSWVFVVSGCELAGETWLRAQTRQFAVAILENERMQKTRIRKKDGRVLMKRARIGQEQCYTM